jgi:integrase
MYRFSALGGRTMPRTSRQPSYRLHKARNCAVVTIGGKNHYLGAYDSPESHEKYGRLIAEWKRNGNHLPPASLSSTEPDRRLLVSELILSYFRHAEIYYVKHGRQTSEVDNIRQALRFVRRLYGATPAEEFGTRALKNVRQAMIDAGRGRKLINRDVHRIRAMIRWGVEEQLLPVAVHEQLMRLRGLRKGRSAAKETPKVEPVPVKDVEAILPHLPPTVAAMVQLQLLCGARPQEITTLCPCEITDLGNGVWYYHPYAHKMEHMDRDKVIVLGPKAQEVLRPWLDRDPEVYCFAPAEASAWQLLRQRKNPGPASVAVDPLKKRTKRMPGPRYTRHSYRVAVQRACRRAGVPVWSPRQLRHLSASTIRAQYGLEASKAVLGHADTKVTEIYAQRDLDLAQQVMREVG